jgi:hypothetical protein
VQYRHAFALTKTKVQEMIVILRCSDSSLSPGTEKCCVAPAGSLVVGSLAAGLLKQEQGNSKKAHSFDKDMSPRD